MRMMRLALLGLAALLLGSASASAVTVKKRIEAPGLPAEVWAVAGAFCAINSWHPAVAECEETKEGAVTYRTLTLQDGGKIKEKLLESDDLSYSYEIIEGPLPVKNYKAKFWMEEDDEPDRSVIYWQADFDAAEGTAEEDAQKLIRQIFTDGVKGVKKKAIMAHDEREKKAGTAAEHLPPVDDDEDDDEDE